MDQRALIIALTAKGKSELVEDLRARQKWLQDAMAEILSEQEHAMLSTAANIMLARSSRRSKTGMARRP
ncbi:DNA-binding MarR family transcriptional regulator [Neorhizobium galegae]|nr:DNA-binding MarR family transcriptional regulator [Neorhizobium galegae]